MIILVEESDLAKVQNSSSLVTICS